MPLCVWQSGNEERLCLLSRVWGGEPLVCEKIECPVLTTPPNVLLTQQNTSGKSLAALVTLTVG